MTVYSKYFDKMFSEYNSASRNLIIHPYPDMLSALSHKSFGALIGACQFYMPIYFVSASFS